MRRIILGIVLVGVFAASAQAKQRHLKRSIGTMTVDDPALVRGGLGGDFQVFVTGLEPNLTDAGKAAGLVTVEVWERRIDGGQGVTGIDAVWNVYCAYRNLYEFGEDLYMGETKIAHHDLSEPKPVWIHPVAGSYAKRVYDAACSAK